MPPIVPVVALYILSTDFGKATGFKIFDSYYLLIPAMAMPIIPFVIWIMKGFFEEIPIEIEEAAHSHELAEGRFENSGQVELITAIREMSRAEARLNSADTTEALVNERAALRALQRAFDRRRYLLRTLPERARIDLSRRLSGELDTARSTTQPVDSARADPFLARAREVLRELDAATAPINGPALASRMLALDPQSEELQKAALQVAAAPDDEGAATAIREAQRLVARSMQAHMAKGSSTGIRRDPFSAFLASRCITRHWSGPRRRYTSLAGQASRAPPRPLNGITLFTPGSE